MKKFNWGWGILIVCVAFVGFISTLVYRAMQEKVDFVTTNYYEKELQFQQQINRMENAAALPENIKLVSNENKLTILYPKAVSCNEISGNVTFFKPDNAGLDFEVKAGCDENHEQLINTSKMQKGFWNVKITWSASDIPYYFEEKIFLN